MADFELLADGRAKITKKVYLNSPFLLEDIETDEDLTNVTSIGMDWRAPNGDEGSFAATGTKKSPNVDGKVDYQIAASELNQAEDDRRPWHLWLVLTDALGSYRTCPMVLYVYNYGEPSVPSGLN